MDKIVSKGLKIDLHIHSVYSSGKDGDKVKDNTEANLPVLIQKLCENDVEMCAITDHDTFNYSLYHKLKEEEERENCIKKVLPGIEFSVEFEKDVIIHIVTIFDDRDDNAVKKIESIMTLGKGISLYKKGGGKREGAYRKEDYFDILAEINLDFVMIAHQKKSMSSLQGPGKHDVMKIGETKLNELIFLDYFDALEFRNRRNELYNKNYLVEHNIDKNLRFITGSDCHNWIFYPNSEKSEKTDFCFTNIKALPTFKGLVMAITDTHRIEIDSAFFNPNEIVCEKIDISIKGKEYSIPLSKGINAIIGDNSIGKSLFLNMLTGDCKKIKSSVRKGYQKYLSKYEIVFKSIIPGDDIFKFNQQGEIRELFDESGLKPDSFLMNYYPTPIDSARYRAIVERELERLYSAIEDKFDYDDNMAQLSPFIIPENDLIKKAVVFVENFEEVDESEHQRLISSFEKIKRDLDEILNNKILRKDDKSHIASFFEMIEMMQRRYSTDMERIKFEKEKRNVYESFVKEFKSQYGRKVTDLQARYAEYEGKKIASIKTMVDLSIQRQQFIQFMPDIEETVVIPETNPVNEYRFVSKLNIEKINNEYIESLISSVLRKGEKICTISITRAKLKEIIKNYPSDEEDCLAALKQKIKEKMDIDFSIKNTIIQNDMEVYEEVSSGFDAQMYFSLLCGETRGNGIYIIDQPEDHISQKAIKERVIDQFRKMGQQRQVIMVTHNPQFIVNLDVDNVIFLSKTNDRFCIQSGALEYEDEEYNILKIVAENIEGGLQTIQGSPAV